jgi:hypothetical protein
MVVVTKIRNINTITKGRDMQIQRRKGTKNPSAIPLDLKVEREEKGEMHLLPMRVPSRIYMHEKKYRSNGKIIHKTNLRDCISESAKKKKLQDINPKKGNSSHASIAIKFSLDSWIVDSGA